MACVSCGGITHDWFGDEWCDACGGVMIKHGDRPAQQLHRHVATLEGAEGRFPIVWNASAANYLFRWPNKVNPRFLEGGRGVDEEFLTTPILSTFGFLDVVMSQAITAARGDSDEAPTLSVSPSATTVERALLGV